ncbi:MAG: hypothetical protein IJ999_05995 [Clostridia bacterium]|nr:hypothetical protein [Clostridia bacterium]
MKTISKSKNRWFFWSLFACFCFVAGIIGVVLFAVAGRFLFMGVCIAMMCFGFFAMPFFWIAYATKCSLLRTCFAIEREHLYKVSDIARHLNKKESDVTAQINKLISLRAINYLFDGVQLSLNGGTKLEEQKWSQKCPSCGAIVTGCGADGTCEYCGWIANK